MLSAVLVSQPGALQSQAGETVAEGPFQSNWESLASQYKCPEWFRDAKFGIWAHWGPQCEPEHSDWYARLMYVEGSDRYNFHVKTYGHPSKVGFKDIIHQWKAANFDPDKLLAFYKENGARYFMALANHHDNFDLWDSKYQPWNSVDIGPKKDLVGGWAAAAKKLGLPFGVSVHASRAWKWYESAQGADTNGPLAGVPYDGKLTKADGKGQWWEGLDPQDLYAQDHKPTIYARDGLEVMKTVITPGDKVSPTYCEKFTMRTLDLIDQYKPDLVYFDEPVLPMRDGPESYGLRIVSHFYNSQLKWHGGRNEGVINTKRLNEQQRKALVYDIEGGKSEGILPEPWQTDTCIGKWHYNRAVFQNHRYKDAGTVIRMLVDIVSKNGNLMLSVPLRRDGTPDEQEVQIVSGIGAWLKVNGGAIYASRPWKVYGEGPSVEASPEKGENGGMKDVPAKAFTPEDIRFTQSKDGQTLFAIVMAVPKGEVCIKLLGTDAKLLKQPISSISLLGSDTRLDWKQEADALVIQPPAQWPSEQAVAFKITLI
ncbi:MAG: alpha-L-fucosidase [bacterium]